MKPQEVNDGIAKVMGLKALKVGGVIVKENYNTKEVRIIIEASATKGQIVKIKDLLIGNLR